MCDLFSWVKDKDGKIWFNTDEDIEAAGMDFENGIGHSAIEIIWKVRGEHFEGVLKVPPEIAAAINRGKCAKMTRAAGWAGIRYTEKGNISSPWWPGKLLKTISKTNFFDTHAEPLLEWKLFDAREDAWEAAREDAREDAWEAAWAASREAARKDARDAAWDVSRDAARDAAWEAAWAASWGATRGASWEATRGAAREAARDAAWGAAWGAARDAAWAATREATRDAAWEAAILATCELAFFKDKNNIDLVYARKRWEVYARGYGLAANVGGVFYVYKRP